MPSTSVIDTAEPASLPLMSFPVALRHQLDRTKRTQAALADALGVDRSLVSHWLAGRSVPSPTQVFEIERQLKISPGVLSCSLGYLPLGVRDGVRTTEEVVETDPALDDFAKRILLTLYRELRAGG